jgi:pimeloyl-ACP methyl ester carboxylesterase
VHGWLLSGRLWQPLTDELNPHWDTWSPDLPGFGHQPRPRGLQPSLASITTESLDSATARGAWRIVSRATWIWLVVIALLVLAGEAA